MIPGLVSISETLTRAMLAGLAGSVSYALYGLPAIAYLTLPTDLPVWIIAVGALTLPVSLASVVIGQSTSSLLRPYGLLVIIVIGATAIVIGVYTFAWYMPKLNPVVNWTRSWPLPGAACLFGFALGFLRWPSFSRLALANSGVGGGEL
jgi:hypothetical protein